MLAKKYSGGVEVLSIDERDLLVTLKKITAQIKFKHHEVKEIILFGSFSKNNFTCYSDIDIAIIVTDTEKNFISRQDEFIDYFSGIGLDINLVIYTSAEFNQMLKTGNTFIKEIIMGQKL